MPLTLSPATEERLRSVALLRGQEPEAALDALLDQALAAEADLEDTLTDLRAGEEEFAAGRSLTLEELDARIEARQTAKNRARQAA